MKTKTLKLSGKMKTIPIQPVEVESYAGNENVLVGFSTLANDQLDKLKKGDVLDRKQLVTQIREDLGIQLEVMNTMDGLTMLSVLLRSRGDFEVIKGPKGGTIKK